MAIQRHTQQYVHSQGYTQELSKWAYNAIQKQPPNKTLILVSKISPRNTTDIKLRLFYNDSLNNKVK